MNCRIVKWLLFAVFAVVGTDSLGQDSEPEISAPVPKISSLELASWIDEKFAAEWKARGVTSPPTVDDATFMRRVYLDLLGTIPSVPHLRDFLYETGTFKREDLVDRLLLYDRRPERFASRSGDHLARIWRRAQYRF